MEHEMCAAMTRRGAYVMSECACGWRSSGALGQDHAERRWRIHASQQRAAQLHTSATAVCSAARTRAVELTEIQYVARRRRSSLARDRKQIREALACAARAPRQDRPTVERTLECARQIAGFSFAELWVRYFAYGGMLNARALEDALCGGGHIGTRDYDVLSVVFNEEFRLDGLGEPFSATS